VFHPVGNWDENTNRPYAETGSDGRFAISTFSARDGAPLGEYKVAIMAGSGDSGEDAVGSDLAEPKRKTPASLPARYADPQTSGFQIRVTNTRNELAPFRLKSGPGQTPQKLPEPPD
jgi:hypothetical protein